jgi:hypothetical protein
MLRIASLRAIFHSPSLSDRAAGEVRVFPPQIAATEFRENLVWMDQKHLFQPVATVSAATKL